MWTDADGMTAGRFALTPEIGGQIKALIDGITGRIFRERRTLPDPEPHHAYAADALTELILGLVAATRTAPAEAVPDASAAPRQRSDCATGPGGTADHTDHAEAPPAHAPTDDPTPSSPAADPTSTTGPSDATDPTEAPPSPAAKPGVPYTVHILIDHTTLLRGVRNGAETCEIAGVGPVDPEWCARSSAKPS